MAAADFCLIPVRPSPADIEAAAPTLVAVRESGKPFAFVLNQVQPRSARLNAAAGSLGERAVSLKIANVLALPAIVMRNDQQDALGMGRGITEYAPLRKVGEGDPRVVGMGMGAAARLAARHGSGGRDACDCASRIRRQLMRRHAAGKGGSASELCQLGRGCTASRQTCARAFRRLARCVELDGRVLRGIINASSVGRAQASVRARCFFLQ